MQLPDKELRTLLGWSFYSCYVKSDKGRKMGKWNSKNAPPKGGNLSISTFSLTTKRLLRCFRGGLPTIGMVSLGPVLKRLMVLTLGGVTGPSKLKEVALSCWSLDASGLTTTMGGAGDARSGAEYRRSGCWGADAEREEE